MQHIMDRASQVVKDTLNYLSMLSLLCPRREERVSHSELTTLTFLPSRGGSSSEECL